VDVGLRRNGTICYRDGHRDRTWGRGYPQASMDIDF